MTQPTLSPDDLALARRKLAAQANNRAWALVEQPRGAAENREMLDAAHASAWLWRDIGDELNAARATMLVAHVHALLGLKDSAWANAETMHRFFTQRDTADWEIAFTHAIHAHAAAVAGRAAEHAASYAQAERAIAAIADDEERQIVKVTFAQVPTP
ncbi:MAG: hypothetical protein JSR18_12290 [Proteobacteria bacterium]|nr:hypothetical protein [Pseudomonadota bacterium]